MSEDVRKRLTACYPKPATLELIKGMAAKSDKSKSKVILDIVEDYFCKMPADIKAQLRMAHKLNSEHSY